MTGALQVQRHVRVGGAADLGSSVPADLYAEGDLAAYLEEWGAGQDDILSLLDSLESVGSAEIAIVMPDEMLEVLSSQQR